MRWLLTALCGWLAACGAQPVVTAKVCGVPHTAENDALFDRAWGPAVRQSAAYQQALVDEAHGQCDAIYDMLHPGYRGSPAYAESLRDLDASIARSQRDREISEMELDIAYQRSRSWLYAPSYSPWHYHHHH